MERRESCLSFFVQQIIAVLNPNRIDKEEGGGGDSLFFSLFSDEDERKRNATQNARAAWPSGLRRGIQAPIRKGEGSNPSAVITIHSFLCVSSFWLHRLLFL